MAKGNLDRSSRAKRSKLVRQILNRHQVDMTLMTFTVGPSQLFFSGKIYKCGGADFSFEEIRYLAEELRQFGSVRTELENWDFTGGSIFRKGSDSRERSEKEELLGINPEEEIEYFDDDN